MSILSGSKMIRQVGDIGMRSPERMAKKCLLNVASSIKTMCQNKRFYVVRQGVSIHEAIIRGFRKKKDGYS